MTDTLPPIAVLLKEARGAYGSAIRHELVTRGFDALPPNGAFFLGALHFEMPLEAIMRERGRALEKGQTIDKLVDAGYVLDDDGLLSLSERGHECAHAVYDATSSLTNRLAEEMGDDGYAHFVAGLLTLIEMKEEAEEA
ncbi:MAG TPA: hypothetical protein VIJ86_09200 [Acidimicrobiales bacterium]